MTMKKKRRTALYLFSASVIRMVFGVLLGGWLPVGETFDDWLMVDYSMLLSHFQSPNHLSLVKYMSFPLILSVCRITGIPYPVFTSLFWVAAALLFYQAAYALSGRRVLSFFGCLYLMFLPMAFDAMAGTRIYRNGVIAPLSALVLSLTVLSVIYLIREHENRGEEKRYRRAGRTATILLSILFPYVYYLKEDSLWLLACVFFSLLLNLLFLLKRVIKKSMRFPSFLKKAPFLLLPLASIILLTMGYKAVNQHFFGVSETNMRTGGEGAHFAAILYSLDSPERTADRTVPEDVLDQAFRESAILAGHPELLKALKNTFFCEAGDYYGDYICWGLIEALVQTGLYTSPKDVSDFLNQVNSELECALLEGRLQKSDRIRLLSSAGGRTPEEIWALSDDVLAAFRGAIHLYGYSPEYSHAAETGLEEKVQLASLYTGLDLSSEELPSYTHFAFRVSRKIMVFYRILNPVILAFAFSGLLLSPLLARRRHKEEKDPKTGTRRIRRLSFGTLVFLGISFLYAFSISWFSSFLYREGIIQTIVNFYQIALPVLLAFTALFGTKIFFAHPESRSKAASPRP